MGDDSFSLGPGEGTPGRPGAAPDGADTGTPPRGNLSAELLRIAFQEAMQARLEAFLAGERVYDELVKAAEARCEAMLAEARAEANRIISDARAEAEQAIVEAAVRQAGSFHDETVRRALATSLALSGLRSQRSSRIQRLWGQLTGRPEDAMEPPTEVQASAVGNPSATGGPVVGEPGVPSAGGSTPAGTAGDVGMEAAEVPPAEKPAAPAGGRQSATGGPRGEPAPPAAPVGTPLRETSGAGNGHGTGPEASQTGSWTVPDWLR
jgi:hypothetical protein